MRWTSEASAWLLACELLQTIRHNATIDWSVQESARAKIWVAVKRLLRQCGYPPNLEAAATKMMVQPAPSENSFV